MSKLVKDHIDRCMEVYGMAGDEGPDLRKPTISRSSYEQMRSDLMLAVGMLAALNVEAPSGIQPIKHPF